MKISRSSKKVMKYLLLCLILGLFQIPAKADTLCELSPQSHEFLDPSYNSEYEPWNQNLQNPDFAAWNQKFDKELQAKVQTLSKGKIAIRQPLQNKFNISMSGRSQKVLKVYLIKASSSPQFDELCEKAIKAIDGAPLLKYPGPNRDSAIFKPISFSMPINQ